MSHRTITTARNVAFTMLAAAALAALGCTGNVSVGGGKTDNGTGGSGGSSATDTGGSMNVDDSCTALAAGSSRICYVDGNPNPATQTCELSNEGTWGWTVCDPAPPSSGSTPLVLSFDSAPVRFAPGLGTFDVSATMSVVVDWPASSTPWLALDRDGNGAIDDGRELFGSATVLRSGARATNGFEALAELDSNGDGRITPDDAAWASLRLWSDADGDRASTPAELAPLASRRILSIDLRYVSERRCDARGNCEIERASFRWADEAGVEHTGTIVDVHLRHQSSR